MKPPSVLQLLTRMFLIGGLCLLSSNESHGQSKTNKSQEKLKYDYLPKKEAQKNRSLALKILVNGKGKKLVAAKCSACHGIDLAIQSRLLPQGWAAILTTMTKFNGMKKLKKKQRKIILDYFAKNYAPIQSECDDDYDDNCDG